MESRTSPFSRFLGGLRAGLSIMGFGNAGCKPHRACVVLRWPCELFECVYDALMHGLGALIRGFELMVVYHDSMLSLGGGWEFHTGFRSV